MFGSMGKGPPVTFAYYCVVSVPSALYPVRGADLTGTTTQIESRGVMWRKRAPRKVKEGGDADGMTRGWNDAPVFLEWYTARLQDTSR